MNRPSFYAQLRALLRPENKWHYTFHLIVILVSSAYWIGSRMMLPPNSLVEAVIYRPEGDDEFCPLVSSISHFNLGDPVDAFKYGHGIASFQVVLCLPHALACAVFGNAGYAVIDPLLSWSYFLVITLLLRECNFGNLSSLVVGCSLAINGPQALMAKLGGVFGRVLDQAGMRAWEYGFPNLLELPIFVKRIPRPMITETLVVLLLYFMLKLWRERRIPTFRRGFVVGGVLAVLAQGDFYAVSALGLLLAALIISQAIVEYRSLPWRFATGFGTGGLACGWFFLLQRLLEHPDIPRRLGVASYPRWPLLFLPGYASLVRVGVVCGLATVVWLSFGPSAAPGPTRASRRWERLSAFWNALPFERQLAIFLVGLLLAASFAQPVQVFVLGKGAQLYHYVHNVPLFYGYAVLILVLTILKLALAPKFGRLKNVRHLPGSVLLLLILALAVESIASVRTDFARVRYTGPPRPDGNVSEPWIAAGDKFRPAFRALEAAFREMPELRHARSFSTFTLDVNILLTAFHGKRAYNPDSGLSTLSDDEIENRLCELAKLLSFSPEDFVGLIRLYHVENYLLGHNKYRFATDHKFSTDDDYEPELIEAWKMDSSIPPQDGWGLVMPKSERGRLRNKYTAIVAHDSDPKAYPDLIILNSVENRLGVRPSPALYYECYTNEVFFVYARIDPALTHYQKAVEIRPATPEARDDFYNENLQNGQVEDAIARFEKALEAQPTNAAVLNNLAWIRAANSQPRFRDGREAVRLAERACETTEYRVPLFVGTLAAAYAEAGRFEEAVATAQRAHDLALALGARDLAEKNAELRRRYETRRAYHEPARKPD